MSSRLSDRQFTRLVAHAHHRFEPDMRELVRRCPVGGTAIDVGAWFGPWTRALAARATRVITLEPNPTVAQVLRRTIPSNAQLIEAAASDRAGTGMLHVPTLARGTEVVGSLEHSPSSTGVDVPVRLLRLDDLLLGDVRFVKIDAEGHEPAVLRGAEEVLERWRPALVIEMDGRHGNNDEIASLLARHGYRGSVHVGDEWKPLGDFDLAEHQAQHGSYERSYLRQVVRGGRGSRYITNVLFEPQQARRTRRPAASSQPLLADLSVVVPALNEEHNLGRLLPTLMTALPAHAEIIVIDDGSRDATAEVARRMLAGRPNSTVVSLPWNRGKGAAIRAAVAHVHRSRVAFLDADMSSDLADLEPLVSALDGHDIAIGSRRHSASVVERQSALRRAMSQSFHWYTRTVAGLELSDTQCGFKAFRSNVLVALASVQTVDRFAFDVELLITARRLGMTIAEVPIHWTESGQTSVRVGTDSLKMARDVVACRRRIDKNMGRLAGAWRSSTWSLPEHHDDAAGPRDLVQAPKSAGPEPRGQAVYAGVDFSEAMTYLRTKSEVLGQRAAS
jgi:FkbM family methyltransferase